MLTRCSTKPDSAVDLSYSAGQNAVDCDFPSLMLSEGAYIIGAGLAIPNVEWFDYQPDAATFDVEGQDVFGSGLVPTAERYLLPMPHHWSTPSSLGGTFSGTTDLSVT